MYQYMIQNKKNVLSVQTTKEAATR